MTGSSILALLAEGDIQITDSLTITQTKSTLLTEGLITSLYAGQNIVVGEDVTITVDNTDLIPLPIGANIFLNSGSDISITGAVDLSVLNNGGGQIGLGGNIFVMAGGALSAGSVNALINNRDGGTIDSGASIIFSAGAAFTTTGDATLILSNRDDGGGNGSFGGPASISLTAPSVSIGGNLTLGMTPGDATDALNVTNVTGLLVTLGGMEFSIQNGGLTPVGVSFGGVIDNGMSVAVFAGNISSGDYLSSLVTNTNGGEVGESATLTFGAFGDISVETDALWQILNTPPMAKTLLSSARTLCSR